MFIHEIISMSSGNSFIDAIISGKTEKAKSLIPNREDVNARDEFGNSALIWAAIIGDIEIVQALLAVPGIKVNHSSTDGASAIILAASNNNAEVVQALLAVPGIDVNIRDNDGRSALSEAATRGHTGTVLVLLNHQDIDVNIRDNDGRSALILAAENGHTETVQALLAVPGILVNARDNDNNSALMLAGNNIIRQLLARREDMERRLNPAQRPVILYGEGDVDCAICFEENYPRIAIFSCGHVFCRSCIEVLIERNIVECPTCKENIISYYQVPRGEVATAQAFARRQAQAVARGQAGGKTRKLARVSKHCSRTKHRKRNVKKSSCKRRKSILGRKYKKNPY
jgi:nitrate reductase NapAB chaperone NapD